MPSYAALVQPSANRVYAADAPRLACAELAVFNATVLGDRLSGLRADTLGGVPYVWFECGDLTALDVAHLSNTSAVYALFRAEAGSLTPLALRKLDRYDDDLVTIQRYPGKTNEVFTKLLVNVTLASSGAGPKLLAGGARVIDPVCGRGSTLNQALLYGCHAAGIEADGRAVDAYETFLTTWLQNKQIKHRVERSRLRRGGKLTGRRVDVTLGTKLQPAETVTVVHDDTRHTSEHFRRRSFDALVADLPYGVQHASRGHHAAGTRNPAGLVDEALAGWLAVLTPGAAVGLAWNTNVLSRADLAALLRSHGLVVLEPPDGQGFEHRVDRAIRRDIIIARVSAA